MASSDARSPCSPCSPLASRWGSPLRPCRRRPRSFGSIPPRWRDPTPAANVTRIPSPPGRRPITRPRSERCRDKDKAREIADKLGLKRIKAESTCLSCHFTSALRDGKATPIAGITCESCHAAGKDWIKLHSDYGGKDATKETETPEHAKERYARSEAAGMIRPVRLYDVAANCYGCHTVPMENLVNVGGHPAGSKFELVQWSQGEVRHNVWYSKENGEASVARKRLMYVLGKALDLEFALRGVAIATKKADYAVSMAKRAKRAENALKKIAGVVDSPEIGAILEAAAGVKLKLNNEAPLTAAVDEVAAAARAFAEAHDGSAFAALDALLPAPGDYRGKVFR